MHEFPLVQRITQICIQTAIRNRAKKIMQIQLELGDFSFVVERLLIESFKIATKGTIAEGAEIVMNRAPGIIKCKECGEKSEVWLENAFKSTNEKKKEQIDAIQKNISATDALTGNIGIGANLFQCPKCKSNNTDLIEGKKIIIKNIRI